MSRRLLLAVTLTVGVACSTHVEPTHPLDPSTPTTQQARASISGAIFGGGAPLAGADVTLRKNSVLTKQARASADGTFLLDGVEPGTYVFGCTPSGYVGVERLVQLGAGERFDLGVLTATPLAATAAIVGRATLAGEATYGAILVEAVGRAYTTVTDSTGAFRLQVPAGRFDLRLSRAGFITQTVDGITVQTGEERVVDAVALAANPATIAGHVDAELAGGGSAPLPNATVTLDGTALTGLTDAAGDFHLTGVSPGSYLLRVVKAGYVGASAPVLNVEGGATRTLDEPVRLALERGSLAGRVTLADTADASGILVEATGTAHVAITPSDGSFTLAGLLGGTYGITARRDGYAPRDLGTYTVASGVVTQVAAAVLARQSSTVSILEGPYASARTIHVALQATGATGFHVSEDPAFADAALGDVAGAPWRAYGGATSVPFTLTDSDGRHAIYVAVSDGTSVLGVHSASVVLDRAAPQGGSVVVGDGSGYTRASGGVVALALSAQDLPTRSGAEVAGLATMQLTNDPVRATWTEVPYATAWTWTVADPGVDGTKWIWVRFVDRAGNVGPWIAASVVLDTVAPSAPSISLVAPPPAAPGTTLSPIVNVALSATDANGGVGGAGLQVRISNTPGFEGVRYQPFLPTLSWILTPGDGTKTVYAQFMDRAGNESLPVSASIRLDTAGPTGASVVIVEQDSRPSNGYTNVATVALVLSAAGEPVTAQASEDPGFAPAATTNVDLVGKTLPVQSPFAFAGLGTRTVWVRFLDAAGNAGSATLAAVTIDTTPPSAVPPALSAAVTRTTAILLTPPDAGQDDLRLSGDHTGSQSAWSAAPAGVAIPVTLTAGDGAKSLTVTWRDRADNTSTPIPLSLILDGTPPTVAGAFTIRGTLGDGAASTTYAASPAVTLGLATAASDAVSGVVEVKLSNLDTLADASWQPYVATSVAWTLAPSDGAKRVYARFRDAAANESAVVSGTITLAATPPSGGTLVAGGGATVTNLASLPLAISAVGAAEMQISVNGTGAGWVPYATAGTATLADPEGQKVIAVRFRNVARVEGGGTSASVSYDHTGPAAPVLALQGVLGDGGPSSVWTTRSAITVSFALPGDPTLAEMALVESATCTFPASPFWQPVAPATTFVLSGGDGPKTVCARFRDRAGNVGLAASATIGLDTIAPTNTAFVDLATAVTNRTSVSGQLVTASIDPAPGSSVTYQCYTSPAAPAWTDCAPAAGNVFTFALTRNAPNVVGVRARDDARNVSAGTLVSVVQDDVAPLAPRITALKTRGDTLTVSWAAPPDVDVSSYDVFYGTASGDVSGSGAAQGDSPVHVAASASAQSLTLTGLTTGATYYVALRATDRAGNSSGLSGQRSGTPDVVNPRVLSTIGGKLLALGVRDGPAATYGYVVQSQGIVQVSLSAGNAEPAVIARAWLPGFLPAPAHDGAGTTSTQLALFDCTHPRTGVAGHCLVVAGAEFRDPNGRYPAWTSPPIVYFPVTGGADPLVAGEVLGALPGRPMRVVHAVVSGRAVVLAMETDAVRAYDLTRPDFPRLVATAAYPTPLQTTLQAGVVGGVLAVWGQFGVTSLTAALHEFDLAQVLAGVLVDRRQTVLLDHTGVALDVSAGLSIGSEGVHAVYANTRVASYALGQAAPVRTAVVATDARGCEPSGTTAGHLWLFCREPSTAPPRPGPRMFGLSTSTLAVFATSPSLAEGSQALHGTAAVYTTQSPAGSAEHVLTVLYQYVSSQYDDWIVRWRYAAGALTAETGDWRDVRPSKFALWDDYLITVRGSALEVVDVSNPLRPRRVNRYVGAATSYQKLVVHGSRLFAATDRSGTAYLEAFQLHRDGSIVPLGALADQRSIVDMVVRGRWLVAARQLEGLTVYDVNGAAPVLASNYFAVSTSFDAVDARLQSRAGVFYPLIAFAAVSGGFQTFTFDGATLAPLSARLALTNAPSSVTVSGSYAAVAGSTSTTLVSVSDPLYPSAQSTVYAVRGPVLFQGGYLVGTGFHGPAFQVLSTGASDGKLVNSGCQGGNLVSADGLYLVACGDNGIALVSALSAESARLVKRFDLGGAWTDSGALVTDGTWSFFGGAGDGRQLYAVDERTDASGSAAPQPYGNPGNVLASGRYAKYALPWDGLTLVFTAGAYVSTSIEGYETHAPTSTWPLRFSQAFVTSLADMPATDGETLWVTTGGAVQAYDLRRAGTGSFPALATGSAPATLSLDLIARWRERVYATGYSSSGDSTALVWDTSTGGLVARTPVTLATGARYLYGLAVRGGYLFYAFERLAVPGEWLGVVQLGPQGDGAGAVDLGTVDISTFSDWIMLTGVGLTVSGDVLNASIGGSWLTFDLAPLWQQGALPAFGAWSGAIDRPWSQGQPRLFVDGPFGYVGGPTYRVFDLR